MKRITHLAAWGAVPALSVSLLALPLFGAEDDKASSRYDKTSSSDIRHGDHMLGQVERANKLIGKTVITSDNQKFGKIDNFVVDLTSGHILYAIVGAGGVLGAGEHRVAVPPELFTAEGNDLKISVDKQKLNDAPQFTKDIDKDTELGRADFVSKAYQYFGQHEWWQGANPASQGSFNNVHKASDLIGMKVRNVSDQTIGKVDNLALDLPAGRIAFVIFSPDSSLNLGNNLYALPPDALTLSSDHKMLTSDISKEKLEGAPHFAKDNWKELSNPAWASQVYQYYGKQAYFRTGSSLRPTGRDLDKKN